MKVGATNLLVLLAAVAMAGELDDFHWREECDAVTQWAPQPTWLGNPSVTAAATAEDGIACFRADEARRGMKWSAPMPLAPLADTPWLV
ncbi:hypothetical protein HQ560_19575, partial [bacterium]|nr:hypothetical protein [bacterium]